MSTGVQPDILLPLLRQGTPSCWKPNSSSASLRRERKALWPR
ncbi:unnamed protein product [Spirodela intermedia]|uniref:Uncharacterized protein n=1 Tax=Spirodela intermedia TaxID=51605 RepID=A0A7I8LGX4_SPIIN|nr:unnamed protein product [Spirodela intermedia]